MRDLQSPRWMGIKAALFIAIGLISCALILLEAPNLRILALLVLAIWSFCRAYYFAFYVIEKYIDPTYRFSGILSALRYLLTHRNRR
jgi:Na+/glutamate symporter